MKPRLIRQFCSTILNNIHHMSSLIFKSSSIGEISVIPSQVAPAVTASYAQLRVPRRWSTSSCSSYHLGASPCNFKSGSVWQYGLKHVETWTHPICAKKRRLRRHRLRIISSNSSSMDVEACMLKSPAWTIFMRRAYQNLEPATVFVTNKLETMHTPKLLSFGHFPILQSLKTKLGVLKPLKKTIA